MFREFDFLDMELEDEFNWGLGRRRRSLSGLTGPSVPVIDLGRSHPHADMHGGGAYPGSVPNLVSGPLEETVEGSTGGVALTAAPADGSSARGPEEPSKIESQPRQPRDSSSVSKVTKRILTTPD